METTDYINKAEICRLLRQLGITSNYTGYRHASHAVFLSIQEPERLLLVTKWIYPDVAKHFNTNWRCVERNIRTVSQIAWESNRSALELMAGHALPTRPSSGAFLSILAEKVQESISNVTSPIES